MQRNAQKPPRGPHGASHQEWWYSREAVVWVDGRPVQPNIVPFAREMSLWLQQKVTALPLHTKRKEGVPGEIRNPYTYSLGALSLVIAEVINEAYQFSDSVEPVDPIEAEIRRIRFEAELTIHAARFCEAAIKQMLHCTKFERELYEKAPMGKLLARECEACKKGGAVGHDISLLGSLAHRFFLCQSIDGCAVNHLQLVARRRNQEAAHSESQSVHPRSPEETRMHLARTMDEVGFELGHMADHIGSIEEKMIAEIDLFIFSFPEYPHWTGLAAIPVRNLDQYPRSPEMNDESGSAD